MKTTKRLFGFGIALLIGGCICKEGFSQSLSPKVTPAAGGYFVAGGKSLSWTLGEPFYTTLQGGGKMLTQGFQQPFTQVKILNIRAFIQGYYTGTETMQPVLYNLGETGDPTICDSIAIELHDAVTPEIIVLTVKAFIHVDGTATMLLPTSFVGGNYYIAFRHRNALETWSKNPVAFTSSVINFDFTRP